MWYNVGIGADYMITGRKFICNDAVGTFFKKHYCPVCKARLNRIKVSKTVNPKSEEAKEFDFEITPDSHHIQGDVRFSWYEFACPNCDRSYRMEEIKKYEKKK